MDLSFVPSLEHLSCERIVMCLFKDSDLRWSITLDYDRIKSEVSENISKLVSCDPLQKKLKYFIGPLLREVKDWITLCEKNWTGLGISVSRVKDAIPECRKTNGSIDREKLVNLLIENKEISPLNRFIIACIFCAFEDVLDLWNSLHRIEKAFLQNRCSTSQENSYMVIKHWIEWLESGTEKDWESFVAFTLENPARESNVFMVKRVLQGLSPAEKNQFLVKALTGRRVHSEMMRFGLSMLSGPEREVIFRESTLQVFRCLLSWPLISVFDDFSSKLWPYVTEDNFCRILEMILAMIKRERFEYEEFLVIMKTFWAQSPEHYKTFAKKDNYLFGSVNFVLKYDFEQQFQRDLFLRTFHLNQF